MFPKDEMWSHWSKVHPCKSSCSLLPGKKVVDKFYTFEKICECNISTADLLCCPDLWQHCFESQYDGQTVFHNHVKCNEAVKWSGTPSACTVVRAREALTRNGSFWFLIERNKDGSHLINEPGFFFSSLEVFKRKTAVSAEHRMSPLGITSNLSESTLWRAEDPLKSARVKLIFILFFFTKNWRTSLESGNKVRRVSLSPPFALSW